MFALFSEVEDIEDTSSSRYMHGSFKCIFHVYCPQLPVCKTYSQDQLPGQVHHLATQM